MNVIILGSGGCVSTLKACCNCRVCTEARQKGFPYARTGCSLFIEDGLTRLFCRKEADDLIEIAFLPAILAE